MGERRIRRHLFNHAARPGTKESSSGTRVMPEWRAHYSKWNIQQECSACSVEMLMHFWNKMLPIERGMCSRPHQHKSSVYPIKMLECCRWIYAVVVIADFKITSMEFRRAPMVIRLSDETEESISPAYGGAPMTVELPDDTLRALWFSRYLNADGSNSTGTLSAKVKRLPPQITASRP